MRCERQEALLPRDARTEGMTTSCCQSRANMRVPDSAGKNPMPIQTRL